MRNMGPAKPRIKGDKMLNKLLLSSVIVAAGATSGFAQGFTGGEAGLEYQSFDDIDSSVTTYYGGVEFGLTPQFAVGLDLSFYNPEDGDDDLNSITLHGIYNIDRVTSIGLFYAQDDADSGGTGDSYGVEAAYSFGAGSVDGYFGVLDEDDGDGSIAGASFDYGLGNGFSVIGAYDRLNLEEDGGNDATVSQIEIGGAYTISGGPSVFAKIGSIDLSGELDGTTFSGDDTYFSIGASIGFGNSGGTTFGPRSIFETIAF